MSFPEARAASLALRPPRRFGSLRAPWQRRLAFAFELLSTGAREQFAAALRVAMAEVLAEAYRRQPCPWCLDDALPIPIAERQAASRTCCKRPPDRGLQVILVEPVDPASTTAN